MNAVSQLKQQRESLRIKLGVLKDKKEQLGPLLKRYKCRTPRDIKEAARKVKLEISTIDATLKDLAEQADAIIEKLEEETNE